MAVTQLVLIGAVMACQTPVDRSDLLVVELGAVPALIVNDSLELSAQVMSGVSPVPNAEVRFSSDAPAVLNVTPEGRLLAVGPGQATVTARAITFAAAQEASQVVQVRDVYELDSITPGPFRYGQTVQLFGVGLNRTLAASFGGVDALAESYVPDDPGFPDRFGTLSLWVAPPVGQSSQVLLLGLDGILISDPVQVTQRDIFEPNDSVPFDFGVPSNRLFNPALAFERVRRGDGRLAVDWYTFTTTAPGDWTISSWTPFGGGGRFNVYVTNSLFWTPSAIDNLGFGVYVLGQNDWSVGAGFRACDGLGMHFRNEGEYFYTFEVPPDSAVIPLRDLPAGTYHVFVNYGEGGPFYDPVTDVAGVAAFVDSLNLVIPLRNGLEIKPGYESILAPDAFEENDYCSVARSIAVPSTIPNLTIDSPHDADWYRFSIGGTGETVKFSLQASDGEADLDTYIVRDWRPDSLVVVDFKFEPGVSEATVGTFLEPGDYFLIVVDFLGVPTDYSLTTEIVAGVPAPASSTTSAAHFERKRQQAGIRRIGGSLRFR